MRKGAFLLLRVLGMIWASPWTMIGLGAGLLGLATGGCARGRGRTLEFYGGAVHWLLTSLPNHEIVAMTWGHVILGQSPDALDVSRDHEMVHVRQYERWGPFFGPAYALCSLVLWLRGKDAYRDNPFEVEAYSQSE